MRTIDVNFQLNWPQGLAVVKVQEGLRLPVTVSLPFVAVKSIMAEILRGEVQLILSAAMGAAQLPQPQPNAGGDNGEGGPE